MLMTYVILHISDGDSDYSACNLCLLILKIKLFKYLLDKMEPVCCQTNGRSRDLPSTFFGQSKSPPHIFSGSHTKLPVAYCCYSYLLHPL